MSFPRYPAYKDSGVEWLGEVPAAWALLPFWTLFRRTKRTGYEGEQLLSVYRDHGVVPKSSRDDNNNMPSDDLSPYQLVEPGDLAINKMKAWQGSVAISEHRGIVSPAYFVYSATHAHHSKFLHYLFRSPRYITGYLSLSKGIRVNQWDLEPEDHSRMPVVIPSPAEQEAIANFLDHETTKIDALVAEKERLIELLKEKRQAIISHAVTKGLDPSVPMKDSGVQWLGEVPAHWEVRQVRSIASFVTSGPRGWSERVGEEGSLFVQSGDLTDDLGIAFSQAKRVAVENDAEAARTRLLVGDVVVCITGAKTGNVAVCAAVEEGAYINQHLCLIRPTAEVLPWFLGVFLKSDAGQRYFGIAQYGLKQGLSLENVKAAPLVVPPVSEQEELVAAVRHASEQMDQLIGEAVLSIELLRERRTALISAAVTGQIDVRGWVPAETAH